MSQIEGDAATERGVPDVMADIGRKGTEMADMIRRGTLAALGLAAVGYGGYLAYVWATTRQPDVADLAYGTDARQKLDIYLPQGAGPFPFVLEIHGGAFKMGSKTMSAPSRTLLAAGIAIVRPNYRYSSTDLWPAQGDDCLAALAHVLSRAADLGLDPERFATWGQSAGGFLSVSTGLSMTERGQPPRAVADFYGPMEFSTMDADMAALGRSAKMGATDAADSAESQLLGFAVGDDPARARAAGPVGRLAAMAPRRLPALFVRHGDADPLIAHGQSERLVAAWRKVDPAAHLDFARVAGGGHGGGDFGTDVVMAPLRDFLLQSFA
jgi:acetyl esterase/lipase